MPITSVRKNNVFTLYNTSFVALLGEVNKLFQAREAIMNSRTMKNLKRCDTSNFSLDIREKSTEESNGYLATVTIGILGKKIYNPKIKEVE